jgi:aspartyl-tRNA(Asn)/glutamyl-tRNA(Gln) amidotransferase subunit A
MAITGDDIFFATAAELNAAWRKGEFSAKELAGKYLRRLEQLGPELNALALSLRKEALDQAEEVDKERKRERFRSRLQAIPFGAKDLLAWPNHPTTWGAKPYATQSIEQPATVLKKLKGTGAVLIGKLAMIELAGGPSYRFAKASLTGPCRNPWNREHWAGGSSSGSGAAVAAGLVAFALGSETSGSILTPSAFCGITGLRPTYGLVSRAGAMALSWTLDKIGPMARSAEDCGIILEVIAGGDGGDPGSAGKGFYFAPQFAKPFAEMTVGYAPVDWQEWVEPETRAAYAEALNVLRSLGVKLKEMELPDFPYGPVVSTVLQGEAGSIFEELVESGRVKELADEKQIAGLEATQGMLAKDYLRAMRIRRLVLEAFREFFYEIDLVVAPSRMNVANKLADPLDAPRPDPPAGRKRGLMQHIPAGNLAGLPALSLPCGLVNGLPIGVTLMGRAFTENALLAVGAEFQRRTDWHKRRPPWVGVGN